MQRPPPSKRVDITLGRFAEHVQVFATLGREHRSSYACCVNAHMAVEAWKDKDFAAVVNDADLSTADGMPIPSLLAIVPPCQAGARGGK